MYICEGVVYNVHMIHIQSLHADFCFLGRDPNSSELYRIQIRSLSTIQQYGCKSNISLNSYRLYGQVRFRYLISAK